MTATAPWTTRKPTALLVLADGTVIEGHGIGATGKVQAEVCFNTALTGYEEILTDPSYLGQIVTFTFPHIGNVGTNEEDIEDLTPAARHGDATRERCVGDRCCRVSYIASGWAMSATTSASQGRCARSASVWPNTA